MQYIYIQYKYQFDHCNRYAITICIIYFLCTFNLNVSCMSNISWSSHYGSLSRITTCDRLNIHIKSIINRLQCAFLCYNHTSAYYHVEKDGLSISFACLIDDLQIYLPSVRFQSQCSYWVFFCCFESQPFSSFIKYIITKGKVF